MGLAVSRILLMAALAASLAACGRAGSPEAPKAATQASQPDVDQDADDERRFILDPLI
ncbi:lipoprotein [Oricola sp.]|uniref:lipoprotein n=1 Tax=Oricola sp. TaxID=1979950 RepID=UPI00260080D7|nr:lipoprotein [Oricola sp.]MCI5075157.1 lipoprotein [Oricola sp.]